MVEVRTWFPFVRREVINSLLCGADAVLRTTRQRSNSLHVQDKMRAEATIDQTNCFLTFDRIRS
jgi:hypothetical protein